MNTELLDSMINSVAQVATMIFAKKGALAQRYFIQSGEPNQGKIEMVALPPVKTANDMKAAMKTMCTMFKERGIDRYVFVTEGFLVTREGAKQPKQPNAVFFTAENREQMVTAYCPILRPKGAPPSLGPLQQASYSPAGGMPSLLSPKTKPN
jgi:hypothetical protein